MYRPPENSNRVKSIKSKFENIEKNTDNLRPDVVKTNNGARGDLSGIKNKTETFKLNLSRQLSDPAKRNIKRTPAFRLDKKVEKVENKCVFERNTPNQRSLYFDNKVKQFVNSALKNNCDKANSGNIIDSRTENIVISENNNKKPFLVKSKSSHDFAYIRSKFDNDQRTHDNNNKSTKKVPTDLSLLYTEPIPKSLRGKNKTSDSDNHVYSNLSNSLDRKRDIYSAETLRVSADNKIQESALSDDLKTKIQESALTDTLKSALKRPLPCGPAPKKPPRTFEHHQSNIKTKEVDSSLSANLSFLHLNVNGNNNNNIKQGTDEGNNKAGTKKDARYMLNRLELALRTNKIKTFSSNINIKNVGKRKKLKTETSASGTSGEDSDDSLLFKSKSKRDLPSVPPLPLSAPPSSFNFNCFNGSNSRSVYEKIAEPNSSFFVSCDGEEPVYAEPFGLTGGGDGPGVLVLRDGGKKVGKNERNVRNSLYYMSTPLLNDEDRNCSMDLVRQGCEPGNDGKTSQKQISAESSSLSSFTSDLDSAASTPQEDSSPTIKQLINNFETNGKVSSLPNPAREGPNFRDLGDSSSRVEDLKMSLQKTLDRCFLTPCVDGQDDEKERRVSVDTIVSKFQTYIKTMPKYQKPRLGKVDRLFYCCLIVAWDGAVPKIQFKFPNIVKIPDRIEDLCFPEAASGPLDNSDSAQCYSLVITNDKGERTFGYCRRVKPEGGTRCLPLTYCILSKHRAPRFYKQILTELESRHGIPDKLRDELISEFYYNKFPQPGQSIKINLTGMIRELNDLTRTDNRKRESTELVESLDLTSFVHVNRPGEYGTLNKMNKSHRSYENIYIGGEATCTGIPRMLVEKSGKTELILTLHHDLRYEEADLKPLHKLPPEVLLKIFASLLLERKVIFISCVMSKLSCCVDALQSILFPFSWPHTFIPILPQCLWDVVESPTPVICGILSVAVVNEHTIEDGIVVDLDEGDILIEEGDENSILSDSMKKAWRQGLALANRVPPEDYVHSVYVSDAYIKVFITAIKHYKNHIVDGVFEKEAFIRNGKSKGIRRFLKWFTETTLFLSFIDSAISNPEGLSLFNRKIVTYGSEESNLIMTKLLEWKKQ